MTRLPRRLQVVLDLGTKAEIYGKVKVKARCSSSREYNCPTSTINNIKTKQSEKVAAFLKINPI